MNHVIIIGRLGRDPEMRYTQDGKPVCNFSVAVDGTRRDAPPTWLDITAWEKSAEVAQQYLRKGSQVAVEGRIDVRTYEKDGQSRKAWSIIANRIEFVGGRPAEEAPREAPQQRTSRQPSGRQAAEYSHGGGRGDVDDPPF